MWKTRPFQCTHCGEVLMSDVAPAHLHDGVAFPCREHPNPTFPPEPLAALEARIDRLEPWLRKTAWHSMTYLLIPSVLASADLLLLQLQTYPGPEVDRARALSERLFALRTGFRREPPGTDPK